MKNNKLINYFKKFVPATLKLNYPDDCGLIAEMVIKRELKDNYFLNPEIMNSHERAIAAIHYPWGSRLKNEEFQKKLKHYISIAEILILTHRKNNHALTEKIQFEIQEKINNIRYNLEYPLTDYENELFVDAVGFWIPGFETKTNRYEQAQKKVIPIENESRIPTCN